MLCHAGYVSALNFVLFRMTLLAPTCLMTRHLIRTVLVGFGHIAQKHLAHIQAHHRFECVGVVEPAPERAQRAQEQGLHVVATIEALLELDLHVDLAVLATPSGLHPEQTLTFARAKIHVLTEKPMALDPQAAQKMIQACEDEGVLLFVAQQMRDWPLIQALKRAVDARAFGRVSTCAMNLFWTRPQSYFDAAPWRGTPALDGGILLNQANHYVDLLVWFFGRPKQVFCVQATHARDVSTDDTCVLTCLWPEMTASLHTSLLAYPKNLESSITILGEQGTIKFAGASCTRVDAWEFANYSEPIDSSQLAQQQLVQGGYAPLYERIGKQVGLNDPSASASDTSVWLDVLELTQAANASAQTQHVMTL